MGRNLARSLGVIVLVITLWVLLYEINFVLFHNLNKLVSWVFLPQGLRIVAVIVFAELGVIGLFLGSLTTIFMHNTTVDNALQIALISAINPYLAVHTARFLLKVDSLFTNLNAKKLLVISFISAIFNSAAHQCYIHIRSLIGIGHDFMVMFIGDFFGSMILLFCMSLSIKWLKHVHIKSKQLTFAKSSPTQQS